MRILILTYPLTPVSASACGGTEQIAYQLLRGLERCRDYKLEWIGAEGPAVGRLHPLSWSAVLAHYGLHRPQPAQYTPGGLADLERRCNQAVALYTADHASDLIHNQGAFFGAAAASVRTPVLFTLHLARCLYPDRLFVTPPSNLHFQCVSQTQWNSYGAFACCGVIGNGIELERFPARKRPAAARAPLLYLGRLCREKGPHLAIEIARRAKRPLWLAGSVAPFPDHQRYFEECILPHLGGEIRWIPAPTADEKAALLAAAAAVVIPSQIEETSSLVAMEAAASGVPALALRIGALPEMIVAEQTGWLADDWESLAELAAERLPLPERRGGIAPAVCRAHAEAQFSGHAMVEHYRRLYRRLGQSSERSTAA